MSELLNPDNQRMMKKYNENFMYYVNNYENLKNDDDNKDKFIAIDGNTIDKDYNLNKLLSRLTNKYGDTRHIFIQYIEEKDYLTSA